MASFHAEGLGCADCLHPADDLGSAPIPAAAFVSFWVGLLTASYCLRQRAGKPAPIEEQHVYLTALRPDHPSWVAVRPRRGCPSCAALRRPLVGKSMQRVLA